MSSPPRDSIVAVDPGVLSGEPVFAGTRVPVRTLFAYLEAGDGLDDFLDGFPSVTRHMALRAIPEAGSALVERHAAPA